MSAGDRPVAAAVTRDRTLLDRELSWVEFNRRVLDQALRLEEPLLERLRFLTIVSSNFDEFFMVRVAALKRSLTATAAARQRFARLAAAAHAVVELQYRTLHAEVMPQLMPPASASSRPPRSARSSAEPPPMISATDLSRARLYPLAGGAAAVASLRLHLAVRLEQETAAGADAAGAPASPKSPKSPKEDEPPVALVAIPSGLDRLRPIPELAARSAFCSSRSSIVLHAGQLFPGYRVADHALFSGYPRRRPGGRRSHRRGLHRGDGRGAGESAAPAVSCGWKSIRPSAAMRALLGSAWEWPKRTCTPSRRSTLPA